MRAFTITQPWASLITIGAKRFETRAWQTTYRGPLAIHAAKGFPSEAQLFTNDPAVSAALAPHFPLSGAPGGTHGPAGIRERLPRGAVIAVCDLAEILPTTDPAVQAALDREGPFGDFTPGRYAWRLAGVRPLPTPIPARGALGLWEWQWQGKEA